jgi:hypothetical protein
MSLIYSPISALFLKLSIDVHGQPQALPKAVYLPGMMVIVVFV